MEPPSLGEPAAQGPCAALDALLSPVRLEGFLAASFEATPLHIRAADGGGAAYTLPSAGGGEWTASGGGGGGGGGPGGGAGAAVGAGGGALLEVRALTAERLLRDIMPSAVRLVDAAPDEGAVEVRGAWGCGGLWRSGDMLW
jgi:hypothetical protein